MSDQIDRIDERLKEWALNVTGVSTLSLYPPGSGRSGEGVGLYLMELVDTPPPRSARRAPLQFALRYLVTTWADEPETAHRLLGELAFAAMESADFEVEFAPLSPAVWTAFGTTPQPSFVLRVPFRRERPEPATRLVRSPVVVHAGPLVQLRGIVLGPGDVPLPGARIEMPDHSLSTHTNTRGEFSFSTVRFDEKEQEFRVSAKGRSITLMLAGPASAEEPLLIHFDPFD